MSPIKISTQSTTRIAIITIIIIVMFISRLTSKPSSFFHSSARRFGNNVQFAVASSFENNIPRNLSRRTTRSTLVAAFGTKPKGKTVMQQTTQQKIVAKTNKFLVEVPIETRLMSSSNDNDNDNDNALHETSRHALSQTPLGKDSASHLLNGLDVYTIYSKEEQNHPLSLYGLHSTEEHAQEIRYRRPILLLHGRTWSSVPVYHLLGGQEQAQKDQEPNDNNRSRSLMEALYEQGLQPYALDFRGFGGTPSDETNVVTPTICVRDVGYAMKYITKKHAFDCNDDDDDNKNEASGDRHHHQQHYLPVLLGWSQGALVAQLFAQKNPHTISKLILYGSIYDPLVSYPPIPLYANGTESLASASASASAHTTDDKVKNTFNSAIEDFTIEGSIPPEPATRFAQAALLSDPYKAQWSYLSQFNNLDPARISVPTLVVAGDQGEFYILNMQASIYKYQHKYEY